MLSVVQMSKDNVYGRYCVRLVVIYDKIIFRNFAFRIMYIMFQIKMLCLM